MLKFETIGNTEIKHSMVGSPDQLAAEMAALIECFTFNLLRASDHADRYNEIGAQLASGFALAVKNGVQHAKQEACHEAENL